MKLLCVIYQLMPFVLGLLNQNSVQPEDTYTDIACPSNDKICLQDRFGFEAINSLHHQIDDDKNGNLDRLESDGFIRDELKHEDSQSRHNRFHGDDDQISVEDLWHLWVQSQVYNWTLDDTINWLTSHVELPQYAETFRNNAVDGHALPRIAANPHYVTNVLGLKNNVHKQKLAIKAMDAVLFGAPKLHNYIKDLVLVTLLVIALGGCWLSYMQHRYSQSQVKKFSCDVKKILDAQNALGEMKEKLDTAEQEQIVMQQQKKSLELKMEKEIEAAKIEAERLRAVRDSTTEEISRLRLAEEELIQVRHALAQAEKRLETNINIPTELQPWLQLTYEVEKIYFNNKKESVEKTLKQAKDMCDKLKKKRASFMGSVRIAHSTSINETDLAILNASAAAQKIRDDLKEHKERWGYIQRICNFNIELNPGKDYLESILYGNGSGTTFRQSGGLNGSMDESEASTPASPSDASLNSLGPLTGSGPPPYRPGAITNPEIISEDTGGSTVLSQRFPKSASVNFNLGSGGEQPQMKRDNGLTVDNSLQSRDRSNSSNNCIREEDILPPNNHPIPRPKTLPSELCNFHKILPNHTSTPTYLEDLSSPESSDNISVGSFNDATHDRKKKKKLINRVFGHKASKLKTP